jgi:type IV pilus assembly protein PilC
MKFELFPKISATNKIFLLQNLSVMIKAGVPLADSLSTLGKQMKHKKLKAILTDIQAQIKAGKNFSDSLAPYEKNFGELFVNMIRAGEASGQLDDVINKLHKQTKKDHGLVMKIRNALTYPVIIIIAMFGIGTFMIVFVLPNITKLFDDLDVTLPLATRVLIGVSNATQEHGILIAVIFIVVAIAFTKTIRTKKGKHIFDSIMLKTPIIGKIIIKINLARTARNLSSLIKTDITIVETLKITSRVVGNSHYRRALDVTSEEVKEGRKIADIFGQYPHIFPPNIIQMISVGEETGSLDEVLENLADFYEEEVYNTMDTLPTIIEPVLMILIGAAVAVIALAIMMPMQTLTQTF